MLLLYVINYRLYVINYRLFNLRLKRLITTILTVNLFIFVRSRLRIRPLSGTIVQQIHRKIAEKPKEPAVIQDGHTIVGPHRRPQPPEPCSQNL